MIDPYGRRIDYLRISVTDRCNLRCAYCMPAEGVALLPREDLLSYEEIAEVARVAAARGVTKLRLTGGEPLVRRDLPRLVAMLAGIGGIRDLAMTTNGTLLDRHARPLARAGLQRVNVSLDAIDPHRYRSITRGGDVRQVLSGIDAAAAAGLSPIRLNCVLADGRSADADDVADYAAARGLEVRFIRRMNLAAGTFSVVQGGHGGDCPRCNRLRLSSDGCIRPCLFSDLEFSVRQWGAARALELALGEKPRSGSACTSLAMHAIGG